MPTNDPINNPEANSSDKPDQIDPTENVNGHQSHRYSGHHHHRLGADHPSVKKQREKGSFETFVARHLLKVLGILLFVGGILWLIFRGESRDTIQEMIVRLLISGNNPLYPESSGKDDVVSILLSLIPGFLFLGSAGIIHFALKGKAWLTQTFFISGAIALYLAHALDILPGSYIGGSLAYSSAWVAAAVTLILTLPVIYLASKFHRHWAYYLSIGYIYISVILLAGDYGSKSHSLFILIFLFSGVLYLLSRKSRSSDANLVNACFATGYFGLFLLRKLLMQNHPDLVWVFISYASVLYLLVMLIHILKPYTGKQMYKSYFYYLVIYAITGFYFISSWYVLRKYDAGYFQWILAVIVTVLNYGILKFKAYARPEQSPDPYYFAFALLAASIIPLLAQQGKLVLYAASASLIFTAYAIYRKNQIAAFTAIGMLSLAMLIFVAKMVVSYYPALFLESSQLPAGPFLAGLFSGFGVIAAAFVLKNRFDSFRFSNIPKWFSKGQTSKYISGLFYMSLYLTSFWIFQYLFLVAFQAPKAQVVSWYVFHITFLLMAQLFLINKKSWMYKPLLWISLVSFTLLPIVFTFGVSPLRDIALASEGAASGSFYFHFICIPVLVLLVPNTILQLDKFYPKLKSLKTWSLIYMMLFFGYLLLAEFDYISVIAATTLTPERIIESNRHLPYSIVLYLASLVLLFFSFTKKIKLFRQLSLAVLILATVKTFGYDFSTFSPNGQAISFWAVGVLFIVYSFLYQRLRKVNAASSSTLRKTRSRHHRDKVTRVN